MKRKLLRLPRSGSLDLGRIGRGLLLFMLPLARGLAGQLAGDGSTLTASREFDSPRLEAVGGAYSRVTVPGCETLQRVGAPLLPFQTIRLLLPPGGEVDKISVRLPGGEQVVPGNWRIEYGRMPVASPSGGSARPAAGAADGPDPAIYESDQPYPPARAELASVQRLGGHTIAVIRLYPVQYWPTLGRLEWTRQINLEVLLTSTASPAKGQPAPPGIPPQAHARERVERWVDNPEMLEAYEPATAPSKSSGQTYDYLLITKSNLVTAFQPLVDLKTQQGLAVRVQTIEILTNTFAGVDVPERIRNCIRDAYVNQGVRYVLLGGDTTAGLPSRTAYVYMGASEDPYLPTDMYYACLDGTWNNDGDARWGEPTDGPGGADLDLLAEVHVGRAPVDTVADVNIFVEKTVRYETQTHPYLTNALFLAEVLDELEVPPSQGGDMFVPLEPLFAGYQLTWLDDRFTVPEWVKQDALNAMNQSPHLVLFSGHGFYDTLIGWLRPFVRSIETPDLDQLTNQWPFLAYSVVCNVGQFDNDRFSPDAIGEEVVKRHSRGAFAGVFNSRFGYYDPQDEAKYSAEFQLGFFQNVLQQSKTNLGTANQLSKEGLLAKVENAGIMTYRYCYYEITLLGDPHAAWRSAASTPAEHQLVIASAFGGASPAVGAHAYAPGTGLTCQVTNSPAAGTYGTRYLCTGWSGTGSVPASGSSSLVAFTLAQDSQLTWLWKTQLWLAASAGLHGSVAAANGWQDRGTTATVSAIPAPYYHFDRWTGDVPAGSVTQATLQLTMDTPRTLTASFAEDVTSQGTPHWWLASFGWTNQLETAAGADTDHDGAAAWQEYFAGTSPVDETSVLRIASMGFSGPNLRLAWPSAAGRRYSIWAAAEPVGAGFLLVTNNLGATPPANTFVLDQPAANWRFFRIGVELAP